MTFSDKLRQARLSLNLTQSDLAKKTGISERSLYSYEQSKTIPRGNNIIKLAEALDVSVSFLLDDDSTDNNAFIKTAKNNYGFNGAREANEIIYRASALFAGGDLNDEDKELFFQSLMEVYLDSKNQAKEKFSKKKRPTKAKSRF